MFGFFCLFEEQTLNIEIRKVYTLDKNEGQSLALTIENHQLTCMLMGCVVGGEGNSHTHAYMDVHMHMENLQIRQPQIPDSVPLPSL